MNKKIAVAVGVVVFIGLIILLLGKGQKDTTENDQFEQDLATLAKIKDADFQEIVTLSRKTPAEQGSFILINKAQQSGDITVDQALGYKLVAMFSHSQLPNEYSSGTPAPLEGDMILVEIQEHWDTLTPETQSLFEPLFLDPSEDGAFFHPKNVSVRTDLISQLAQL